jgi:YD repeat-containing protein
VIGVWAAVQGCVAVPGADEGPLPNLFGRVGTGDTAATGDTGLGPAVRCRVLREQHDYDSIDYTYVDHETYTVGVQTFSTGRTPITETFDTNGVLLSSRSASWAALGWFYDAGGRPLVLSSVLYPGADEQRVERYTYDGGGRELSHLVVYDQNAPTNADKLFLDTSSYDADGRLTGWGYDQLVDGVLDGLGTFTYDSDGLLVEQVDDWEPSTPSDWSTYTTRWEYDERGLPTRSEMTGVSWTGGPTCDFREYTHDDRGDLVIEENVSCVSGRVFLRWTDTYDDRHRRTESVWDLIDPVHPGPDDEHWWWTYDEYGNLTSEVREQSGLTTTTWTWECR